MHSLCLCAFVVLLISVGPTVRIASVHRFAASLPPAGPPTPFQISADVQKTVNRALPILQRSTKEFVAKRACVSCHHNILSVLALHQAAEHGFTIDANVLSAVEEKTFHALRAPDAVDDAIPPATSSLCKSRMAAGRNFLTTSRTRIPPVRRWSHCAKQASMRAMLRFAGV